MESLCICWLTLLTVARSAGLFIRTTSTAKLGLRAVLAGGLLCFARFSPMTKSIFLCGFPYLCVCLGDPSPQTFIFHYLRWQLSQGWGYSSILRGSQTRSCCLPQPHPSRTPFTSVPVNVGKNRELSSYKVPHSCFHSESSPESTPHWSLPARNSWSLAGPGRAAFWLRTAICSSRLLPVCH